MTENAEMRSDEFSVEALVLYTQSQSWQTPVATGKIKRINLWEFEKAMTANNKAKPWRDSIL